MMMETFWPRVNDGISIVGDLRGEMQAYRPRKQYFRTFVARYWWSCDVGRVRKAAYSTFGWAQTHPCSNESRTNDRRNVFARLEEKKMAYWLRISTRAVDQLFEALWKWSLSVLLDIFPTASGYMLCPKLCLVKVNSLMYMVVVGI